jgi:hypothetical protein
VVAMAEAVVAEDAVAIAEVEAVVAAVAAVVVIAVETAAAVAIAEIAGKFSFVPVFPSNQIHSLALRLLSSPKILRISSTTMNP